jgi:hypothetical protein
VVDRRARRVDALGAIQRERVKPERHLGQHTPRHRRIHLKRQDIRDLLLRRLRAAALLKRIHKPQP